MKKALRGINLGGWLVAERWMTPDLFSGVESDGELALYDELGYNEATNRLKKHHDSFVTEKDFRFIADQGFDFVRLPVGYWIFEKADKSVDGEMYVKKAFTWAHKYGLGVVLDFHGLQGSQNGDDHSGRAGRVEFYRLHNMRHALGTLRYICRTYGHEQALLGIEVINEPKLQRFIWPLMSYYRLAIRLVEQSTPDRVKIIVSDGFQPLRIARELAKRKLSDRVVLDVHLYQVFSESDMRLSMSGRIQKVNSEWSKMLGELSSLMPIMVGEWSAALPVNSASQDNTRAYYEAQKTLFDSSTWAHSYWSYKAPGNGAWSYRDSSLNT